jgi:multiple sugar transport system permease protein
MANSKVGTGEGTGTKQSVTRRTKMNWVFSYVMIAPLCIGLAVFYLWPFVQNLWFSFNNVTKFNISTFCGLDNYVKLLRDQAVWKALGNTLKYVVITVPVGMCFSIFLAALLNMKIRGKSFYRVLYFLPSITMSAAVAMVWKWIFNEQMGILNSALQAMGLSGHNWLTDSRTSLYCIMIVGMWMTIG